MCRSWPEGSSNGRGGVKRSNYRVRFRHGVYPNSEGQATREDIKKFDYFFGGGQVWVSTPDTGVLHVPFARLRKCSHPLTKAVVEFVDESAQIAEDFEDAGEGGKGDRSQRSSRLLLARPRKTERTRQAASRRSSRTMELNLRATGVTATDQGAVPAVTRTASSSGWPISSHLRSHISSAPGSISSIEESLSSSWRDDVPSPLSLPIITSPSLIAWPLEDPIEAHLFRFWVDKAAAWWDITSSHDIFKEAVPKLALGNSMLMNAIFMISAQHIQRFDLAFPARPYLYHERILQQLIPYLAEKGNIEDEATLVAVMLLRSFEEFHAGTHGQRILSTFELFQGPYDWRLDISSPVVQACLMVHVRFEIYQGLLDPSSVRIDYQGSALPFLESPSDDVTWGNGIVWLCARILQWAERDLHSADQWYQLVDLVDAWERERPSSFDAFFYRGDEPDAGTYLPEMWFSCPCHVDANQHLRICRIALATSFIEANRETEHTTVQTGYVAKCARKDVLKGLKEMMAIARCNTHAISASSIAAHAIHKFAGVLQEDLDQHKTIEFLEEVNTMGRPTVSSMEWLRGQWCWSAESRLEQRTSQRS
ncbi:Nn.00g105910.m01.CDS01 [Neocucurbitaria sp. VM-36]